MAAFAFIHGASDTGWYWHLVEADLRARGHDTVAPDLPVEDDSAGLVAYADVVADAIGERTDVVVVAQSFGGYVAPIVAEWIGARLIVLVAAMMPSPGESADEMFPNTGWRPEFLKESSSIDVFYHDVAPELAQEAHQRERRQSETPGREPWPLSAWPRIPTRFLLCRNDRLFPADWLRRVVHDRLGVVPDEIESGHCPALSQPHELGERLHDYAADVLGVGARRGGLDMLTPLTSFLRQAWRVIRADQRGLTTLEYVIAAGIILVVLAAAIVAWNNGLSERIGELVGQLLGQ